MGKMFLPFSENYLKNQDMCPRVGRLAIQILSCARYHGNGTADPDKRARRYLCNLLLQIDRRVASTRRS